MSKKKMGKLTLLRYATEEDYKKRSFWNIGTLHRVSTLPATDQLSEKKQPADDQQKTQSESEGSLKKMATIIINDGPFTKHEADELLPEQLADYIYFTAAILRDLGEDKFRQDKEKMRLFFIRRLARGQPLMPSDDELNRSNRDG